MAVLQLTDLILMKTPLGDGYAIILETNAQEYYWTVALQNGAVVTFRQDQIRIGDDYTHGRGISTERMKQAIERQT